MSDDWSIRRGSQHLPVPPSRSWANAPGVAGSPAASPSPYAPSQAQFSAASRSGALSLPSLGAASRAVDAALAGDSAGGPKRLEFLPSPGIPVRLEGGGASVDFYWPYAPGSRHGGPEQLAPAGESASFREHMQPFAAYFGAGTRGPVMAWLGDQASRGELPKGSPATQRLQEIAQSLFWDVPMQQTSDDRLIARGMPADLSTPEAMGCYLSHQRDAIADLVANQNASVDGSAYVQAGRELLAMVEAAVGRAEGFAGGDRTPMTATPMGPFAWYNHALPPSADVPPLAEADPAATLAENRQTAQRLEQDHAR